MRDLSQIRERQHAVDGRHDVRRIAVLGLPNFVLAKRCLSCLLVFALGLVPAFALAAPQVREQYFAVGSVEASPIGRGGVALGQQGHAQREGRLVEFFAPFTAQLQPMAEQQPAEKSQDAACSSEERIAQKVRDELHRVGLPILASILALFAGVIALLLGGIVLDSCRYGLLSCIIDWCAERLRGDRA